MDQEEKKLTVKDVARLAGVSKGTVDRVLHNRGEVSERSRQRVQEVIGRIGYRPNVHASRLASRRIYTVACLFPCCRPGEFWELVERGIECARAEEGHARLSVQVFRYEQYDKASFRAAAEQLLAAEPDGVVLAPMFSKTASELSDALVLRGIPFVLIDSRLEELPYLAYYGMPMYQSGMQGAALLMDSADQHAVGVLNLEHPDRRDNPTARRVRGFMAWMQQHRPRTTILEACIRPYDPPYNIRVLDAFFAAHPEVRSLIMFNSRVHLIAAYLEHRNLQGYRLVGYDMLERNLNAVRNGWCNYLIANTTELQACRSILSLLGYLAFHKAPAVRDNYSPIDILTPCNVDYYFHEE